MTISQPTRYPFGLQSSNHPAIEFHKNCQNNEEVTRYKLKVVLLQEMRSNYIINLIRSSVEGTTINFLYQYEPLSLISYLKTELPKEHTKMNISLYQILLNQFADYLIHLTHLLTHYQVKSHLSLSQIAAVRSTHYVRFKYFIEPDVEFMALGMPCRHDAEVRLQIARNRQQLFHFYMDEKHRIVKQFENILESTFKEILDSQNANLIINGPSLMMLPSPPLKKHRKHQRSYSDEKTQVTEPKHYKHPQALNHVFDLKAKYESKLSQIKAQLKKLEEKLQQKERMRRERNSSMCDDLRRTQKGIKLPKRSETMKLVENQQEEEQIKPQQSMLQLHSSNDLTPPASKLKYKMTIITEQDIQIEKMDKDQMNIQISKGKVKAIKEGELTQHEVFAICNSTVDHDPNSQASTEAQIHQAPNNRNSDTHVLKNIARINSRSPDDRQYEGIIEQKKKKVGHIVKKFTNIENFGDKVRQAKLKAERLIKRYALSRK